MNDLSHTSEKVITNNASESLNTVIESLQNWKEAPVDSVVLSFHHLQNYYLFEIKRGFCGIGNYSVKLDYANAVCDPDDVICPQNV